MKDDTKKAIIASAGLAGALATLTCPPIAAGCLIAGVIGIAKVEKQEKARKNKTSSGSYYPTLPESAETAIARREPYAASSLLDRTGMADAYTRGLSTGAQVARNYLGRLTQEQLGQVRRIDIYPEVKTFFGRRHLEVKIRR